MQLSSIKMQEVNQIETVSDDTVSFMFQGDTPILLHRDGPRFVLIENDTFTEDRDASPEEAKMIERIFNVADLALDLA
jgi:hypothetical protein